MFLIEVQYQLLNKEYICITNGVNKGRIRIGLFLLTAGKWAFVRLGVLCWWAVTLAQDSSVST
jgi:hypothetical protein